MKIVEAQFMEPVQSPVRGVGGGSTDRFKEKPDAKLHCRVLGPGLILEVEDQPLATVIPWVNVKYALVNVEEGDSKPAKKVG